MTYETKAMKNREWLEYFKTTKEWIRARELFWKRYNKVSEEDQGRMLHKQEKTVLTLGTELYRYQLYLHEPLKKKSYYKEKSLMKDERHVFNKRKKYDLG